MNYRQIRIFFALLILCHSAMVCQAQLQPPAIEWQRTYGGSMGEHMFSFLPAHEYGYIFVATTMSTDGDVINPDTNNVWLVKINQTGNIEWQKTYRYLNFALKLSKTYDGYILTHGQGIVKYNKSGDTMWTRNYQWKMIHSIKQTRDSGYIVCGKIPDDGYDLWAAKLDSLGNIIWEYSLSNPDWDQAFEVVEGNNGEFLIGGEWTTVMAQDPVGVKIDSNGKFIKFCVAFTCAEKTLTNDFITGYGGLATILWSKADSVKFNLPYGASDVHQALDSGFILGRSYLPQQTNLQGGDINIRKISLSGSAEWDKILGGSQLEYFTAVLPTSDSGYIVAGSTMSADSGINNHGGRDAWIVKLGKPYYLPPVTNLELVSYKSQMLLYPTVTKDRVNILLKKGAHDFFAQLINYAGQKIDVPVSGYGNEYIIDLSAIASGNYLLQVTHGSESETFKIVKE